MSQIQMFEVIGMISFFRAIESIINSEKQSNHYILITTYFKSLKILINHY